MARSTPPAPKAERPKYVSLQDAADQHGVSQWTIRRRIAAGAIPAYRVGGALRLREADLHLLATRVPAASL